MRTIVAILGIAWVAALTVGCADYDGFECEGAECSEPSEMPWGETLPGAVQDEPESPVAEGQPTLVMEPQADPELFVDDIGLPVSFYGTWDAVTPGQLSADELARIDILRTAIDQGVELGKLHYVETISLTLAGLEIVPDYESDFADEFGGLFEVPSTCPFVEYYDNGFTPSGESCDYLVNMAMVEAYSELTKVLGSHPLPAEVEGSDHALEASFWYEQGMLSGLDAQRVVVRNDLKSRQLCNAKPTPVESSYDAGLVVGRQLMADKLNGWLEAHGHVADYPAMSSPVEVCNLDEAALVPAYQDAVKSIGKAIKEKPLCEGYMAPTEEDMMHFGQAKIDYQKAIKNGVDDEFSLAAVRIFKQVNCNVSDPLVLDLDRDGFELLPVHEGVNFDLHATGRSVAMGWVHPDDGLLVRDRNGNGIVDDGLELFGDIDGKSADGIEMLALLDKGESGGNEDGRLTAADALFAELAVWKDANGDGVTTRGELVSLAALGIDAIRLRAMPVNMQSGGQTIRRAVVVESASGPMLAGDAFLANAYNAHPAR